MEQFLDANGVQVEFSTGAPFGNPMHVLVVCRFRNQWVLTRHKKRGLEFPGGKREPGESIEEAARREVFEETGGSTGELLFLGQYRVHGEPAFIKSIYYAELLGMNSKEDYLETDGPVLVERLPDNLKTNADFSFIMKDQIVELSLKRLKQIKEAIGQKDA